MRMVFFVKIVSNIFIVLIYIYLNNIFIYITCTNWASDNQPLSLLHLNSNRRSKTCPIYNIYKEYLSYY